MCELQDETYSDDLQLRQVKLNKLDAILDDALNVTWSTTGKKKIERVQKILIQIKIKTLMDM